MGNHHFKKIHNPYVVGKAIEKDAMFFGRKKSFSNIKEWVDTNGLPIILLVGSRNYGKTSILIQIKNGRMEEACESIFFDCKKIIPSIKTDEDFLVEIEKSILSNDLFSSLSRDLPSKDELKSQPRLNYLIDACLHEISPKKLVFLFDGIEDLEKAFEDSILTDTSLVVLSDILIKPVFFIMTSSKEYTEKTILESFSHITQHKNIYELSEEDTFALIKKPVEGVLEYQHNVVDLIYRLSGGNPFFVQYICHTIINCNNSYFKKQSIALYDIEEVTDFIVENPAGYIQDIWKKYANIKNYPKNTLHFLACLAATINHSDTFINKKKLIKIKKVRGFVFTYSELKEIIFFLRKHSRLVEWSGNSFRFRTDIMRLWIANHYPTGEDIFEYFQEKINLEKIYRSEIRAVLINNNVIYHHRVPLDSLQKDINLSYKATKDIEDQLRISLNLRSINWVQEYSSSCLYVKNKYSGKDLRQQMKIINTIYIDSSRLSKKEANKIIKQYKLNYFYIKEYVLFGLVVLSIIYGFYIIFFSSKSILENTVPVIVPVKMQSVDKKDMGADYFEKRYDMLLYKRTLSFDNWVKLMDNINKEINGLDSRKLRGVYIKVLERVLSIISSNKTKSENKKYKKILEIHKNNIKEYAPQKYFLKEFFKKYILEKKLLYGTLEVKNMKIVDIVIEGEPSHCTNKEKCQSPLKISSLLSGEKIIHYIENGENKSIKINLHPNQKVIIRPSVSQ